MNLETLKQQGKQLMMLAREALEVAALKRLVGRLLASQTPPNLTSLSPETMRRLVIIMALEGAAATDIPHRDLIDNAFQLGDRVREQLEDEAIGATESRWDMERGTESSVTTP
jgi:L-2-hydroxyglutarate oxidase LhgO